MKIYLDNCCFNRPSDDQDDAAIYLESEAKLFVQEKIKSKKIGLVWSYMLSYENSGNPDLEVREKIENWSHLAESVAIESAEIISMSESLIEKGFKKKDALHIACALESKADIFFTTDKGILKKRDRVKDLKILNPVEFILWEDEK